MLTLTLSSCCCGLDRTIRVIKGHGLDIERAENGLLVDEIAVVAAAFPRRQDDAHITLVDVHSPQISPV